jgi:hypothetical protein
LSRAARLAVLAGTVVAAVAAFLLARGLSSQRTEHPSGHALIRVVGAKPQGGVRKLTYNKGELVNFTVASDVADEVHVHGFNIKKELPSDAPVSFRFRAKDQGVYVIELEHHEEQIAELEVR